MKRAPHLLGLFLLFACGGASEEGEDLDRLVIGTKTGAISVPAGMYQYCSLAYPSGGWAVSYSSADPCAAMLASSPGGTIARAGRISVSGYNNVLVRCDGNVKYLYRGAGGNPLLWAFDAVTDANHRPLHSGCVFTAAPQDLPIFNKPFAVNPSLGNPLDLAAEGLSLDVAEFGQPGSSTASLVDYRGRDLGATGYLNNHRGFDWGLPLNTPLYAVADGVVLAARNRYVGGCNCGPGKEYQKEILIKHTVRSGAGDKYREEFVSYYAHLSAMSVQTGQAVTQGQLLGLVGSTGCSSGPHLHFQVTRLTNTATDYRDSDYSVNIAGTCPREDNGTGYMDPYGWQAPQGMDPWAHKKPGWGAFSINLWKSGQRPARY